MGPLLRGYGKIFWTPWLVRKLNARKYMRNINDNVVQGHLSKNYLTVKNYCMKYFGDEIFAISGSLSVKNPELSKSS